jgi:RHS repeat-associated protein
MKVSELLICAVVLALHICHAAWDDPFYDYRGQNSFRESQTNAPHELYDPFTGNFQLVYTDLFIPGNGGLDLKVMRIYNSKIRRYKYGQWRLVDDSWIGLGWSMHMGRLVYPQDFNYRYLEMPDGSKHRFYSDINTPGQWISKEYWILRQDGNDYEVLFPNGQRWWFNGSIEGHLSEEGGPIPYYPTKMITEPIIDNPTGHRIIVYYEVIGDQTMIYKIKDSCDREIYFYYESAGMMNLQSICANGKWIYYDYDDIGSGYSLLTRVRYPDCPSDRGDYYYTYSDNPPGLEYELQLVQDKYDSETWYYNTTRTILARQYRVLHQRQEYHDGLGVMQWSMTYGTTTNNRDSTAIVDPFNTTTSFVYYGYHNPPGSGDNWTLGLMMRKRIIGDGVNLVIHNTHDHSPAISDDEYVGPTTNDPDVYVPRILTREYIIDNKTYSTNYSNFDIYNHPRTISETGDISRTITRTYWPCPNPDYYIIDRLESENLQHESSNHLTTYTYRGDGKITTKNVCGVITTYTYHSEDPPPPGRSGNLGNLKSIRDGANRWVEYDDYEFSVPKVVNKGGLYSLNRTINWEGTIASETNGRGFTTLYNYDGQNRLVQITPPVGNPTVIQYNLYYGDDKTISRGPSLTTYYYDRWGRVDSTLNSVGVKVDYEYDAFDRKTYESYAYTDVNIGRHYEYDCLDRLTRTTNPDNSYSEYNYYQSKITYRNENGKYTEFQYGAFGNPFGDKWLVSVKDAFNQTTVYEYNAPGFVTAITADGAYSRTFHYNSKYFLDYEISPERGQTDYTYDNSGNLLSRTDANGNQTGYTYDNLSRLTHVDYPGYLYDIAYVYDNADNCTQITTPNNVVHLSYDAMNRVTQKVLSIDSYLYSALFGYDLQGWLTSLTYPDNTVVEFTYDSEGRVSTIPGYTRLYIMYHPSGRERRYDTQNGTQTTVEYDDRYRAERITVEIRDMPTTGGRLVMKEGYQYDYLGNLLTCTDYLNSTNNQVFAYDNVNRLLTFAGPWGDGAYSYVPNYAISRRSHETIGANMTTYYYSATSHRLSYTAGEKNYQFAYDNNGNLTNITNNMTLIYDYENKPVRFDNLATGEVTQLGYDGRGDRIFKAVSKAPLLTDTWVYYFTGLQGEILCEITAPSQITTNYVYLNGKCLCKVSAGKKYFYHHDYLGNVKAVTDEMGAKIYAWIGYPFGEEYQVLGGEYNSYRFTGKELDLSTGFYYFGARYYMSEIGRFITPDVSVKLHKEDPMAMNAYTYCSDNPTKYVDPDGRFQTREDHGKQIAYCIEPEIALLKDVLHMCVPGSRTIENFVRIKQKDMTLSQTSFTTDLLEEIVGVLTGILPPEVSSQIRQIEGSLKEAEQKSPYESMSEYKKSQLDKKIFEEYTGKRGQREIVLGEGKEALESLEELRHKANIEAWLEQRKELPEPRVYQ